MSSGLFKVYRSSAGSGKTFTLVREYLRLALSNEDPSSYRQILAITFTNKAAAEMRERVLGGLKGFSQRGEDPEFDEVMFSMLRKELNLSNEELSKRASACFEHMLHHYSDVAISTIDKFVHSVIRSFARDLQLNPEFEVDIDSKGLLERSIDELLSLVGIDEALSKLLIQFAHSRMEDESNWEIKSQLLSFAEQINKEQSNYFFSLISDMDEEKFGAVREVIQAEMKAISLKAKHIGERGLSCIESSGVNPKAFPTEMVPKFFHTLSAGDLELPKATVTKAYDSGKYAMVKASAEDKELIAGISEQLSSLLGEAFALLDTSYPKMVVGNAVLKGLYPLSTLKRIEEMRQDLIDREGILPLADFNRMVSAVVAGNPAPYIYERIGERYNHFLIDEFQDTSVLQWQNFLPLVENSLAKGKFNMIVGDGKQAIYRWRGGEVEQFDRLPEIYKHQGNATILEKEIILKQNFEEARLSANFRSRSEVIDFNNRLFTFLANDLSEEYRGIYDGHEQQMHRGPGGLVSVDVIPKGEKSMDELNLSLLLRNISEAKKDGYPLSSMAVICRKNDHAERVAGFLLEQEIPVISSESLKLNQDPAVELILSSFRLLNHPEDSAAALSLIKNYCLLNDRSEEIDKLIWKYRKEHSYGRVWIDIQSFFVDFGLDEMAENRAEEGLYESFEWLVRVYHLDQSANIFIEFLAEQIHQFAVKKRNDTESFIDWWQEKGEKKSIRMADGLEAVTVITIHKSKGLEYPVVFMPYLNWWNSNKLDSWIELDDDYDPLRAALVSMNKSFEETPYRELYIQEKDKVVLDDLNLLYVSCTRARDRLYLICSEGKNPSAQILRFLEHTGESENVENGRWLSGEPLPYVDKKERNADLELKTFPSRPLYSQLKLSLEAPRNWDPDQPMDARERGSLLHGILENYKGDVELSELIAGAVDQEKLREKWLSRLERCMKIPLVQTWFSAENEARPELSFLDEVGNLARPDRVVFKEDGIEVIDYKTGERNERYHKQVANYMKLASAIYQKPVRGFILYLDLAELEEVRLSNELFDGGNFN